MALTKRQLLEVLNTIRLMPFPVFQFPQSNGNVDVLKDFVPRENVQALKDIAENAIKGEMP